ncbi:MAG: hypothetical protein ABI416_00155 [Ginsengibacter sp.]
MKKILVTVVMASMFILPGCKSGGGDPKLVLTNFFEALAKKDFTAVKKYTTKESEGLLGMMQMGMQNMEDKSNEMEKFQKENMEIGAAVIDGDKATVPVKEKKSGESTDFTLKREGGDWKVAFDKSTLMEMAQKKMTEHGMGDLRNMVNKDSLQHLKHSIQNLDSISKEGMQDAQKMVDSANKMLNDAKK